MADAPISGLPETTTVGDNDLLLLQQNNTAKKISGRNWKQYFNANVVTADASAIDPTDPPAATYDDLTNNLHLDLPTGDYFVSCTQTGTVGNKSIYTLTSALGHTAQFEVMNGTGGAPSDADPVALGTASPGIDPEYSRADHVHPIPSADMVQALALSGTQYLVNPVDDLSNYATGFALFNNTSGTPVYNFPYDSSVTQWALVISGKADAGTVFQVAYNLLGGTAPRFRNCASGTWSAWADLPSSATALTGAVPVASGGTGATTAAAARSNLGAHKMTVDTVVLDDQTVPVNDYASFTISAAKTGYTPIGIVGYRIENATNSGTASSFCWTQRIYMNNSNNVIWWLRNTYTGAAKIKLTAYVLYGS